MIYGLLRPLLECFHQKGKRWNQRTIKIEYFLDNVNKDHFHHLSLLQIIFNSPTNDAKILNKRGKVLKENAILALCDAQIHQNHYTINKKTVRKLNNQRTKVVINHRIRGLNNIQLYV
jgi:hypothetical protein